MYKVSFTNKDNSFHQELKRSVDLYFSSKHINKTGNWKLFIKTATLVPAAVAVYILLLLIHFPAFVGVVLCTLLGFILASIGFNIMHDANHGAYSKRPWVNTLMGL